MSGRLVSPEASSWLVDGRLLPVAAHDPPLCVSVPQFPHIGKDTILLEEAHPSGLILT